VTVIAAAIPQAAGMKPMRLGGEPVQYAVFLSSGERGGQDERTLMSLSAPAPVLGEDQSPLITFTPTSSLGEEGELISVIQRLSLARSLSEIQQIVRVAARRLTGADGAAFVLRDGECCFYADEDAVAPLWKGRRFPISACISGWVMTHRRPVTLPDIYADDRIPQEAYRSTFVRSLAMVPIRRLDPVGAIGNYWADHHEPSDREVTLLQALADSTAVALEHVRVLGELDAARREGLERLALAAEYRDDGTREHPARVGYTSLRLAQVLGMDDDRASLIGQAAALHDVGKLAIPDAILLKRNKLAEHEFEKLKTHTIAGAAILGGSQSTLMRPAEQIALTHHERWDGSGYPNGLAGPDIPMTGRIVALADVFDALTHPRPYKAAWSIDATLSEIRSLGGKQFDPAVIDAFMELDPTELVELPEDAGLVATGPPV
jgi:response regulator RpfG family c-di-GMP phosphodiesterase